ncbi:MAG TPA: bifunctional ADP-heptose synthase [Bacteroidia bacterium]
MIGQFKGKRVMIVGDVMVDAYIIGKVDRLSPEAPVPVVNIERHENRLGGAANVALNIIALEAIPVLCSVIGKDKEGDDYFNIMNSYGLSTDCIIRSENRRTTTKTRVLGNQHQLLRIDNEVTHDLDEVENQELIRVFKERIKECDVVILEDYNKGVLNEQNIQLLIDIARNASVPIAVDPKKKNFLSYKNVTLFKPNLKEIKEGLNVDINLKNKDNLELAVKKLHQELNNDLTMVTLSEDGVMISDHTTFEFIPAHFRNISDVSGAGDTVISVASLCLACGFDMKTLAELSNLAGGLVCEETGVVPINPEKLEKEAEFLKLRSN